MLGESRKAAVSRRRKAAPSVRTVCCPTDSLPPAGRKGTFDKAERVESALALLSQKVTKAVPIGTKIEDKNREDRKV